MKFSTAVLVTLRDVVTAKSPFSVHDITKSLRDSVNKGDIAFSDKDTEDVDGVTTFLVSHDDVREIFNDLFRSGVLNLTKKHNGSYFTYEDCGSNSQCACKSTTPSQTTPASQATSLQSPPQTSVSQDFSQKVDCYLLGRGRGSVVSMKQVQSRFDSLKLSCTDYATALASLGYRVDKSAPYPSKWTVTV